MKRNCCIWNESDNDTKVYLTILVITKEDSVLVSILEVLVTLFHFDVDSQDDGYQQ